jgi:CRISPR/Cas system CSM-associated protein Csm3 (group 7 of RAMP superfamily)
MQTYKLKLTLLSDTTPGRGDGVAGAVDVEVEHDRYGMPFVRGRSLKGLLVEEWANLRFALEQAGVDLTRWDKAAYALFGRPGSTLKDGAAMHVGHARLPADLRQAIVTDLRREEYQPVDVLDALTDVRYQTAVDLTGKPVDGTLRAMRVILRKTAFEATLRFPEKPSDGELALLSACVHAARRLGTARNRGRGRVKMCLYDEKGEPISKDGDKDELERFAEEVQA